MFYWDSKYNGWHRVGKTTFRVLLLRRSESLPDAQKALCRGQVILLPEARNKTPENQGFLSQIFNQKNIGFSSFVLLKTLASLANQFSGTDAP